MKFLMTAFFFLLTFSCSGENKSTHSELAQSCSNSHYVLMQGFATSGSIQMNRTQYPSLRSCNVDIQTVYRNTPNLFCEKRCEATSSTGSAWRQRCDLVGGQGFICTDKFRNPLGSNIDQLLDCRTGKMQQCAHYCVGSGAGNAQCR